MADIQGRLIEYEKKMYRINHKRKFVAVESLDRDDVERCFEFSYEMAYGSGKHRNIRSGGEKNRFSGEIFINTFQGKLAEFAMYRYLKRYKIDTTSPDLTAEGLGVWDEFDLEYGELHIAVKSTKYYGNLLLLETEDWNEKGEYIPNAGAGVVNYDYFVLLRISPDGQSKMKEKSLLNSEHIEKGRLKELIHSVEWKYDIAGYITKKDFVRLIEKEYVISKGAVLNGKTVMDAENYYVQAGDMRRGEELIKRLLKYKLEIKNK